MLVMTMMMDGNSLGLFFYFVGYYRGSKLMDLHLVVPGTGQLGDVVVWEAFTTQYTFMLQKCCDGISIFRIMGII